MKKSIIVLFALLLLLVSGCSNDEKKESQKISQSEAKSTVVYITKTGECYHTPDCICLSKSKTKKDLSKVAKKYRACQLCYPPIIEK